MLADLGRSCRRSQYAELTNPSTLASLRTCFNVDSCVKGFALRGNTNASQLGQFIKSLADHESIENMADTSPAVPLRHDAGTGEALQDGQVASHQSDEALIEARVRRKLDLHVLSLLSFLCMIFAHLSLPTWSNEAQSCLHSWIGPILGRNLRRYLGTVRRLTTLSAMRVLPAWRMTSTWIAISTTGS